MHHEKELKLFPYYYHYDRPALAGGHGLRLSNYLDKQEPVTARSHGLFRFIR